MNRAFKETKWHDPIIWYGGDDMEFTTQDWDWVVVNEMSERNGHCLVAGPDGYESKPSCPTWFFCPTMFCGEPSFVWPDAACEGTDKAWGDAADGILRWLPSLVVEHHHSTRYNTFDETAHRIRSVEKPVYGDSYYKWVYAKRKFIYEVIDTNVHHPS